MKIINGFLAIAVGFGAFLMMGATTADARPPSKDPLYAYHQRLKQQKRAAFEGGDRKTTIGLSSSSHQHAHRPYYQRKKGVNW
jgi:hypothetical protein